MFKVFSYLLLNVVLFDNVCAADSERIKKNIETLSSCQSFIQYDDTRLYTAQDFLGPQGQGTYFLKFSQFDSGRVEYIQTNASVKDVATVNGRTFVLTEIGLEEWDLSNKTFIARYLTFVKERPFLPKENPQAMAVFKDKIVIAHGRIGITIFDTTSNKVTNVIQVNNEQAPLESMVTGVSITKDKAYFVLDNYTTVSDRQDPPFRGLMVVDMNSETVISKLDRMSAGGSHIETDDQWAFVSFNGIVLWKYDLNSLNRSRLPSPKRRVWDFPSGGHPVGKGKVDDKYYYTCFNAPGFSNYKAVALERKSLMLN